MIVDENRSLNAILVEQIVALAAYWCSSVLAEGFNELAIKATATAMRAKQMVIFVGVQSCAVC